MSVHGIADVEKGSDTSVAIGDTFLFSPHFCRMVRSPLASSPSHIDISLHPHVNDAFCLTHGVAQYRTMLGTGAEAVMARRVVSATKSVHM